MKRTDLLAWAMLLLGAAVIASVVMFKEFAVYITLFAVGLSLALQKYVAGFFGYFVIRMSGAFKINDRIRIGNLKGEIKHIGLFHFLLKEIGEEEKLGGEFTGRVIYVPNIDDTQRQPKILVHLEPKVTWIEGKFVTPVMKRNSMRTLIYLEFMDEIKKTKGIELADK